MNILFYFFATNIVILVLFVCSKYFDSISDNINHEVRKIHSKRMIKFGGITYLLLVFYYVNLDSYLIQLSILFSFLFLFLGLAADIKNNFSPAKRLIISSLFIYLFIELSGLRLIDIGIPLLNQLLQNFPFISFIFTIVAVLFCINGSNLIDGQHGLLLGSSIIILVNLILFISVDSEYLIIINYITLITVILFIYNFFTGSIRVGDNGAYFLGFILSIITIYMSIENYLSPFHAASILFYPVIEAVFSYLRRVISNVSPFKPDALHLHSNLYFILINSDFLKLRKENANRLSSLLILLTLSILWLIFYAYRETISYEMVFISLIVVYLFFYYIFYFFAKRLLKSL